MPDINRPNRPNAPKAFDIHRNLPPPGQRPVAPRQPLPPTELKAPPTKPQKKPKRSIRKRLFRWLIFLVLAALALLIFIGVWDARNISAASRKMFGSSNLVSLVEDNSLKTDANGRVNVLIVGYSVDDPDHPGANLTDSLILLSMNPATHTGYMLSIPRDLYVKISDDGYGKINEVYEDGGMGLLEQTVSNDFGVSIGYYALIDYAAVRDTVNALGGVTINIQSPDSRGLYDPNISPTDGGPLVLKNGVQTINGQTALNLTRARGDTEDSYGFPQSDFDRTQHQRQIFQAIKAKLNWKLILNPRQNSKILNAVAANVKTDIPVGAVRPLFGLFNSIPNSKLSSLSLNNLNGKDLLQSYTDFYGASALIPAAGLNDFSQIDSTLQQQD